jgi:PAS domain S-box-containing protein
MRDVVGKRMLEYVSEIEEHWLANYGKVATMGEAIRFAGEYKGLDKHFEVYAFKIGDAASRRVAVLFTDITARKTATDALRRSEERYRALIELSPQFVFMSTPEGAITYVNQFVSDFSGKTYQELLGDGWANCIHPDHRAAEFEKWIDAISNERNYESDVLFLYRDGTYRTVFARSQPVRDESGNVLFWIGIAVDVEERKRAQEALLESEARSKLAQEAGGVGVWDWDAVTDEIFWSDTMWALYAKDKSETQPDSVFWDGHIHAEDQARVKKKVQAVLDSNALEYSDEFRIIDGAGDTRWIECRATIVRDANGKVLRMYGVNLDVTEKKLVEQRIRASETQLRLVTNTIPALVSYVDDRERFRFVNNQYSQWFGKPADEFVGKKVREIVGSRAYQVIRAHIEKVLAGEEASFDAWLEYKGAGERFVHVSYVPDRAPNGVVVGYFGLVNDLTELKRSEELLNASQERMRLLTESFTDYAIYSTDKEGRIDSWNPGAAAIFGYSEAEAIGISTEVLFTREDNARGALRKEMLTARRQGRSSEERWLVRKDGSRFFASGVMVPLYVGNVLAGYAKIASDLTERKRTAEALQRAHDEMEVRVLERTRELAEANAALRAEIVERQAAEEQKIDLLKRLVTTQEDERRRIARDLHDQLGQRLTALRLKIASLRELVTDDEVLRERTNRLQEIGEMLDSEVSFLAWELRPSAIEELGLVDAIGTFAREWSRHYGIPAEYHSSGMAKLKLDPEADTHLYRIAQEALNNIVKHANAKRVNILLENTGGEVILIVEDDGKGFDRRVAKTTKKKTSKGLGLTGMEERASLIGGKVEIESAPGTGTTIFARVPMKKSQKNGNR